MLSSIGAPITEKLAAQLPLQAKQAAVLPPPPHCSESVALVTIGGAIELTLESSLPSSWIMGIFSGPTAASLKAAMLSHF